MIEAIKGYIIKCDSCGEWYGEVAEDAFFKTKKEAREVFTSSEWFEFKNGDVTCPDCEEYFRGIG